MPAPALYARISGEDTTAISITRQVEELLAAAERDGHPIPQSHRFTDEHKSGGSLKRPALQELIRLIKAGQVSHLYTYELSRLSRNITDTYYLFDLFKTHKVKLVVLYGMFDDTSAEGIMATDMQIVMNKYWRIRTSFALARYWRRSRSKVPYNTHTPPKGMTRTGSASLGTLQWHKSPDFPLVVEILTRYLKAWSTVQVWKEMQHRTWADGSPLDLGVIQKIVYRVERYASLLDPSLLQQVVAIRDAQAAHRSSTGIRKHPVMLLRGILTCAACGAKLLTSTRSQKNRADHFYYQHYLPNCKPRSYVAGKVDAAFWDAFAVLERITPAQRQLLRQALQAPTATAPDNSAAIDKLNQQLEGFARMRAQGEISAARFAEWSAKLEAEIAALKQSTPAPAPHSFTGDELDLLLETPVGMLRELAARDSAAMNRMLRLILRVEVSPDYAVRLTWLAPFGGVIGADA